MGNITRRTFLKQMGAGTLGLAAALCGGWRFLLPARAKGNNRCPACGSLFLRPAAWEHGSETLYFCPACGIGLRTGKKHLDWSLRARAPRTRSGKQAAWEVGELPFPNPALVQQTDKPAAALKQLNGKQQRKGMLGV